MGAVVSSHQSLVRAFHEKFAIPVLDRPQVPSDERVRLRLRLIAEEFQELMHACLDINDDSAFMMEKTLDMIVEECPVNVILPEAIDALGDLEYVIAGSACEFGTDMGPIFQAIHAANMRKDGGGQDAQGKIQKPPGWVAPDVAGLLRAQGWEGE